jgi:hypothetical protein
MCRVFVWPRLILPVPVFLKRLAAPEWVFNLGILFSRFGRVGSPENNRKNREFPAHLRPQPVYRKSRV